MARHRNPRFAPEFLEKKLSPSGILPPTTAIVGGYHYDDPEPLPAPVPGSPLPPPPSLPMSPILPGCRIMFG